jgi:hypothetical protein
VLALVQKKIWPECVLFFQPEGLVGESRFSPDHSTLGKVKQREALLLKFVFMYDFFAPETYISMAFRSGPMVQMQTKSLADMPSWGKVATGLWFALLLAALWRSATSRWAGRPLLVGLLLCIIYNLFLHTLYGDDLFLYSCNTCFCLVAWMIINVSEWKSPRVINLVDLTLLVLACAELLNNIRFAKALMLMRSMTR